MKTIIDQAYISTKNPIENILQNFDSSGELLVKGRRNTIKIFEVEQMLLNVKAFRKPNFINKFIYRFIRKSKAQRSFEFAKILLQKNIGTPKPIAFAQENNTITLGKSFYICEHINADLTFRELVEIPDYPEHEIILRAFTRFCIRLHDAGVEFKDHSPGNTLITKSASQTYDFYLVDLNRMRFHDKMSFELRMKNLCRLTPKKEMVMIMANEYAKHYTNHSEQQIFDLLWNETSHFQERFHKKQRMKKKLKFWKKINF